MKCQRIIELWIGMESQDDFEKILPSPWLVKEFVDAKGAKLAGEGKIPHAFCAVPDDVVASCEELFQSLYEAVDKAKFPDDGVAGHKGEMARTYRKK